MHQEVAPTTPEATDILSRRQFRVYLYCIISAIVVFAFGIFLTFIIRHRQLMDEELLARGRAHFNDIVLTRRWVASYGGVYVEKRAGVHSNPYLTNPDITAANGTVYTLKNPALVAREISALAELNGLYRFHITSDRPRNPANGPDSWERESLANFAAGAREAWIKASDPGGRSQYRYMAPLMVEAACLTCHADQGYTLGEVRGGISVSFDIDHAEDAFRRTVLVTGGLGLAALAGLIVIVHAFSTRLFQQLSQALVGLRGGQTALVRERAKLKRLVDLGIALTSEQNMSALMDAILDGAMEISGADGGMFLLRSSEDMLSFSIVRANSLGIYLGGRSNTPIAFPGVRLWDARTGATNRRHLAADAVHSRAIRNVPDVHAAQAAAEQNPGDGQTDYTSIIRFDRLTGYQSRSLLIVPLMPRDGQVVGVLQLLNAHDAESGGVIPFSPDVQAYVEALAAQAAVAIDNHNLLAAQRRLMDSFIELLAQAIDAKSPYTGGHCSRVPEVARLLAEAASATREGPLAEFALTSPEEWREFRIAGLLHDCGKVTTPEYVVDKATKLETVYNRIHEIRTRFEVLWRDAELAFWRGVAAGEQPRAALEQALTETHAALQAEFAFVAACNIGDEFMSPERSARLREIGGRTWLRHFDDRLGLSSEESNRLSAFPPPSLPVVEPLLADRPEHIMARSGRDPFGEAPHDFKVNVPEAHANQGELYNLSISRGTLTAEERFKITDHAVQTIRMLERMPFPRGLTRIPEYAGAHHEALNGTGYPRRLTREEISIPARIIAIADIFEALTACDRPYKKAKKLSEALKIMAFMARDQHIDSDLFVLFLTSGAYRQYADRYLPPGQADVVDIEALVNTARPVPARSTSA